MTASFPTGLHRLLALGPLAAAVGLSALCPSCIVWRRDYDGVVSSAAAAKTAADTRDRDQSARIADLQQRLTAAEAGMQERDGKIGDLSTGLHNLQAQLDEATAINQELRAALERLGKDADKLLAERGTLSKALDDARVRLEELRRAQAAAEARVALFRDFELRFAPLIQAGQLRVESRRGAMVMNVAGDLLFEPGRAELRTAGKGALMEIARALSTASASATSTSSPPAPGAAPPAPATTPAAPTAGARRFLVTAHVDDEPVAPGARKHGRSPWELTAVRGAVVVEYLTSLGVAPAALVAAGGGAADPLAPNDTADGRARNRRVEIALWPTPDATPASAAPAGPPLLPPPPK